MILIHEDSEATDYEAQLFIDELYWEWLLNSKYPEKRSKKLVNRMEVKE